MPPEGPNSARGPKVPRAELGPKGGIFQSRPVEESTINIPIYCWRRLGPDNTLPAVIGKPYMASFPRGGPPEIFTA